MSRNIRRHRHIQSQSPDLIHVLEDFSRRAVQNDLARIHDDDAAGGHSLFHKMRDIYDSNAFLAVQTANCVQHFRSANGVEHGGGFVQNQTTRLHSQHAGDRNPLLLAAGQQMRSMQPILRHSHHGQGLIHAPADLGRRQAQVLWPKGHIFLHNGCDNLIVRVLKHHAHPLANVPDSAGIFGINPVNDASSRAGNQQCIQMLGQCRFPGSIAANNRHEFAGGDFQTYMVQGPQFFIVLIPVGMTYIVYLQHYCDPTHPSQRPKKKGDPCGRPKALYTSSSIAISAASPWRGPSFRTRV